MEILSQERALLEQEYNQRYQEISNEHQRQLMVIDQQRMGHLAAVEAQYTHDLDDIATSLSAAIPVTLEDARSIFFIDPLICQRGYAVWPFPHREKFINSLRLLLKNDERKRISGIFPVGKRPSLRGIIGGRQKYRSRTFRCNGYINSINSQLQENLKSIRYKFTAAISNMSTRPLFYCR